MGGVAVAGFGLFFADTPELWAPWDDEAVGAAKQARADRIAARLVARAHAQRDDWSGFPPSTANWLDVLCVPVEGGWLAVVRASLVSAAKGFGYCNRIPDDAPLEERGATIFAMQGALDSFCTEIGALRGTGAWLIAVREEGTP